MCVPVIELQLLFRCDLSCESWSEAVRQCGRIAYTVAIIVLDMESAQDVTFKILMRGLPGAESGRPAPCSPLASAAAPWQHHPASEPQLPPHPHAASRLLAAQSQAGSAAAFPTGHTSAVLCSLVMLQQTPVLSSQDV